MSTGSKKVYRKAKRPTEKDKRMAQLEKEIARLENENSKLKRDSVGYENRLAALAGTPRFTTEFPGLHRELHSVAQKRVIQKSGDDIQVATHSRNTPSKGSGKKKLRVKLVKVSKKSNGKK